MKCSVCGKEGGRIIKSGGTEYCSVCYQLKDQPVYPLPQRGEIACTIDGLIICHICGRAFNKPLRHVYQKHGMTAYEYKKEFGLDLTKGVMSDSSKEVARTRVYENADLCIVQNLIHGGKRTRYRKGSPGRTKDKVSVQTMNRLKQTKFCLNKKKSSSSN